MPRRHVETRLDGNFGRRLHQARVENGMSQAALARELGVSQQLISKFERGETECRKSLIPILVKLFNKGFEYWFDGNRPEPPG